MLGQASYGCGCPQEPAAWVEHGLLDHLISLEEDHLRDREAERLRGANRQCDRDGYTSALLGVAGWVIETH